MLLLAEYTRRQKNNMLTKEQKQKLWQAGNDDEYLEDELHQQVVNHHLPDSFSLSEEDQEDALNIYRHGIADIIPPELEENPIATINSHINAIADILATNDLDQSFKTAILRQIKSIKAILRKEVLK